MWLNADYFIVACFDLGFIGYIVVWICSGVILGAFGGNDVLYDLTLHADYPTLLWFIHNDYKLRLRVKEDEHG